MRASAISAASRNAKSRKSKRWRKQCRLKPPYKLLSPPYDHVGSAGHRISKSRSSAGGYHRICPCNAGRTGAPARIVPFAVATVDDRSRRICFRLSLPAKNRCVSFNSGRPTDRVDDRSVLFHRHDGHADAASCRIRGRWRNRFEEDHGRVRQARDRRSFFRNADESRDARVCACERILRDDHAGERRRRARIQSA